MNTQKVVNLSPQFQVWLGMKFLAAFETIEAARLYHAKVPVNSYIVYPIAAVKAGA
jgi:hypothetical protein